MKKIPTIFIRNPEAMRFVTEEWHPDCLWVRDREGKPTVKRDGTACLIRNNKLYKRYELKPGKAPPPEFEPAQDPDPNTGKQPGWVPVGEGPEDKWHREAHLGGEADGTYELVGPKVQGNPEGFEKHHLLRHGAVEVKGLQGPFLLTFAEIRDWLELVNDEGIVWHHPDGRMAKIKRRDFGFPWPVKVQDASASADA